MDITKSNSSDEVCKRANLNIESIERKMLNMRRDAVIEGIREARFKSKRKMGRARILIGNSCGRSVRDHCNNHYAKNVSSMETHVRMKVTCVQNKNN